MGEILPLVRPSKEEEETVARTASELVEVFSRGLSARGHGDVDVTVQGSVAHGTWLPGALDIDVFAAFPKTYGPEAIRSGRALSLLAEIATAAGIPWSTRYAQHPYLTLKYGGFRADVVPCVHIEMGERPITATDRTPLHTLYLRGKLEGKEDEVRLLKAFMKVGGIYGAEVGVGGFSGYLAELLIVEYGSFQETVRAAKSWRPHQVIDVEGHYSPPSLARKRFDSPLIMIDPVDPSRNAAAAVTLEAMSTFTAMSLAFTENPSPLFFKPSPPSPAFSPLLVLMAPYPAGEPPDSVWGQLRRASSSLANALRARGFQVYRNGQWTDEESEAAVFIAVESLELPPLQLMRGPSAGSLESLSFLKKHGNAEMGPFIAGDRWYAVERRRVRDAAAAVREEMPRMPAAIKSASIIKVSNREELESLPEKLRAAVLAFLSRPTWLQT